MQQDHSYHPLSCFSKLEKWKSNYFIKPNTFSFQQMEASTTFHYPGSKATNVVTLAVNQNEKGRLYLRSLRKNAVISWLLFKRDKEEQVLFY